MQNGTIKFTISLLNSDQVVRIGYLGFSREERYPISPIEVVTQKKDWIQKNRIGMVETGAPVYPAPAAPPPAGYALEGEEKTLLGTKLSDVSVGATLLLLSVFAVFLIYAVLLVIALRSQFITRAAPVASPSTATVDDDVATAP